jgi:hypothetical protein
MKASDYMTHDEALEIDGCPVCERINCACEPEPECTCQAGEPFCKSCMSSNHPEPEQRCRFCESNGNGKLWYGLCDSCNERERAT